MHDESRPGCLKVVTGESVNTIRTLLNKDRHLTLRELKTVMNNVGNPLSQMLISHNVMEKLAFCKMCARWVPHQLSPEHKTNRMATTFDFLERYERDSEDMLSSIVTGDETRLYHFIPSTKKKLMVWKEAPKN